MGQIPQKRAMKKEKSGFGRSAAVVALLCFCLCLVPIGFGEAEPLEDYEFQRIQEAYKVKETALGLSPEVRDFWEGREGNGDAARAQMALASKKGSLEDNPFYHLLAGEIYSRQQEKERAG